MLINTEIFEDRKRLVNLLNFGVLKSDVKDNDDSDEYSIGNHGVWLS